MSCVRLSGPAHRLRRERDQLLREVPDGREVVSGQKFVALAQSRLAENLGGDGRRTTLPDALKPCQSPKIVVILHYD